MFECSDDWVFECLNVRMFECSDDWMFGCLDVWSRLQSKLIIKTVNVF